MFAATHHDNWLVLVFFGIAILFQILSRAGSKGRKKPDDPTRRSTSPSQRSRPLPREADDTDQIRKFLEALGQPTTSTPPPPAKQRPTYQKPLTHVPPFGSPLPPLKTRPPDLPEEAELPREIRLPGQIPPIRRAKTFRPTTSEAPFEVHQGPQPPETPEKIKTAAEAYALATAPAAKSVQRKSDVATLLRSTSGLRDAIILREIFGPPRSMQPLDLVGSF